jgi:tRNA 2-thiocytidine biosynthesis protein TtcA
MRQRGLESKILKLMSTANKDFNMITEGDRILVALSGGKDSYGLMWGLMQMKAKAPIHFDLVAFHLDQGQPNYDGHPMERFIAKIKDENGIEGEVEYQDTYSRVVEKTKEGKSYCSLCSRFRRAIMYKAATRHGCNKVALGHHRDDLIETLLLNVLYAGSIKSMPPRLRSDAGTHEIIRPLAYVPEDDMALLADYHQYEIMPCNLCGSQVSQRKEVKHLLTTLEQANPHVKGNLLNALGNVEPSQLMDPKLNPLYAQASGPNELSAGGLEGEHEAPAKPPRAIGTNSGSPLLTIL